MVKVVQNSFLSGQLDFSMMGRTDIDKYRNGASVLKNFNFMKQGGIEKRNGFDRLISLSDSDFNLMKEEKVRLVPFAYKKSQGFVLLFAANKCWAFSTVKGSTCKYYEVSKEDVSGFSENSVKEFDYVQCGYRMFIVHQDAPPSEIRLDPDALKTKTGNVFTWKKMNFGDLDECIPTIEKALQSRQAPRADQAGGTFTEYYKASAVFNDIETKPCNEFSNPSCILPVDLGTKGGCPIIQKNYAEGDSKSSTTTTVVASASGECNGTKYYLPWVDSQVIKLKISASQKDGKNPELINIYKKSGGVFGLIGSTRLRSADIVGNPVSTSVETGNCYEVKSHSIHEWGGVYDPYIDDTDYVSSKSLPYEYSFDEQEQVITEHNYNSLLDSVSAVGHRLTANASNGLKISFNKPISPNSYLMLTLGKIVVKMTDNADGASGKTEDEFTTGWQNPIECSFEYLAQGDNIYVNLIGYDSDGKEKTVSGKINITGNPKITLKYRVEDIYKSDGITLDYDAMAEKFKDELAQKISDFVNNNVLSEDLNATGFVCTRLDKLDTDGALESVTKIELGNNSFNIYVTGVNVMVEEVGEKSEEFWFEDKNISPDTSKTPIDSRFKNPFEGDGNYPGTVCVAQQRLVFASTKNKPETIWMSAVGDFTNFAEHEVQTVDDALEFALPVTRFAKLNHIVEMKRILAFNSACEWVIESTSTTQGLNYETICARPQSYTGANERLKPLVCANSVVYSERTGQAVRRFAYDITNDGYAGMDVSVMSSSIFERNSIVDWTYQQFPMMTVWCVLQDGTIAGFMFMEEQKIMAWGVHSHGGGKVVAISTTHAVAPSIHDIKKGDDVIYDGCSNEEVFIVLKTDSGLFLERMRARCKEEDAIWNSLCLDSMQEHEGYVPEGYIGVNAANGKIVDAGNLVDGFIGIPIKSEFTSVYPMTGDGVGAGMLDVKGVVNVALRLKGSDGGRVKAAADTEGIGEPIRYDGEAMRITDTGEGYATVKVFNRDADNIKPRGVNSRDGRISVTHDGVFPFSVIAMETDYATES